jgi:hypothetical protein
MTRITSALHEDLQHLVQTDIVPSDGIHTLNLSRRAIEEPICERVILLSTTDRRGSTSGRVCGLPPMEFKPAISPGDRLSFPTKPDTNYWCCTRRLKTFTAERLSLLQRDYNPQSQEPSDRRASMTERYGWMPEA